MEILFENQARKPRISLVLLDWSVRESFHMLEYLQEQNTPRDLHEVIWIEYYGRKAGAIRERIDKAAAEGKPSPVDVWCVMDMPEHIYYHKHLMYNVGIVLSRGDIVCFCDSDAVVRPTFIESIIKSFEEDSNIVLHLDELRSFDRRFYPFSYPPIDEMERTAKNLVNGKTIGLLDKFDPLHTLNYGACMCARREDLIAIGGADEHMDYLGHVCGPYEMTFRLVNAGKRKVWHQSELLLHTWHPGQSGGRDYIGPHDGINFSTTALDIRKTGRVMPLKENPALRKLREGAHSVDASEALGAVEAKAWTIGRGMDLEGTLRRLWLSKNPLYGPRGKKPPRIGFITALGIYKILLSMLFKQTAKVLRKALAARTDAAVSEAGGGRQGVERRTVRDIGIKMKNLWEYMSRMWAHNRYMAGECREALDSLGAEGVGEVAVFGTGEVAAMLCMLAGEAGVRISGVYDDRNSGSFYGHEIQPLEALAASTDKVILASFINTEALRDKLKQLGVNEKNILYFE